MATGTLLQHLEVANGGDGTHLAALVHGARHHLEHASSSGVRSRVHHTQRTLSVPAVS